MSDELDISQNSQTAADAPEIYLHIGFHKTGTTYLQKKVFPAIEDITYYPLPPIAHLVEQDYPEEKREELLHEAFGAIKDYKKLLISRESLSGGMWIDDPALPFQYAGRLKLLFPDARIILCLREQKSYILSHYAFLVRRGNTWRSLSSFYGKFKNFYGKKLSYDGLIGHYKNLFGPENILCLLYEELNENPARYQEKIANFMNIEIGHEPSDEYDKNVINASIQDSAYINAMRFFNFFNLCLFACLRKVTPAKSEAADKVRNKIMCAYEPLAEKLFKGRGAPLALDEKQIAEIEHMFRESNRKTAVLINENLSCRGYSV